MFKPRFFQNLATIILVPTVALHLFGVVARMVITGRPPVTALYETFLFVGVICALFGLVIRFFQNKETGNLLAAFGGLSMLMISNKFAADGDTLQVLVAVLDSNFWLATHVVAITLGYAGTVAAGIVAHIWLYQAIKGYEKSQLQQTYSSMMGILAFGLIMSFVGTVLGGVWADQSWGRFWGWDPKENGALLIVLWLAVMYHAKMSGWIHQVGMAIGACVGIIVVMLAWFGINLLGVGLHSYGFTSGLAVGLFTYIGVQLVLIAVLIPLVLKKGYRF